MRIPPPEMRLSRRSCCISTTARSSDLPTCPRRPSGPSRSSQPHSNWLERSRPVPYRGRHVGFFDEVAHRLAADFTSRSTHPPPPQLVPATRGVVVSHPHSGRPGTPPTCGGEFLGQNFLHDRSVMNAIVQTVARTDGHIVEVGAGDDALTYA